MIGAALAILILSFVSVFSLLSDPSVTECPMPTVPTGFIPVPPDLDRVAAGDDYAARDALYNLWQGFNGVMVRLNLATQLAQDAADRALVTTTAIGTQHDFDPGIVGRPMMIRLNNATLLTITGFLSSHAYDGQSLVLANIGTSQVDLRHQNTGSAAAGRLINVATSGNTSLAPGGSAEYLYDSTTARWRLIAHDQGTWITPTFAAGNFTGSGAMTWTVDAGDVFTLSYFLRGRQVMVNIAVANTSVGGTLDLTLNIANAAWGGFTATNLVNVPYIAFNASATGVAGTLRINSPSTAIVFYTTLSADTNWLASTNTTNVYGHVTFEVN